MNLSLPQKDLEIAANVISNLVERNASSQAVLANVLIDVSESGVIFRGADKESIVTVNLSGTVHAPGRTTVPADTFRDIVNLLPPQSNVTLREHGRQVTVTCEGSEYKLMTDPASDFPEWTAEPGASRFQLSQKVLKYLIESTTYALPAKDHRRVLMGVYFELQNNTLRLTATDGKKLARVSTNIPEVEGEASLSLIIPRKLLENAAKVMGNEGPVDVELSTRQVSFRIGNTHYRGNAIDGKYPDCDAVIPKDFPTVITLNRDVFLTAARRAGVTADGKTHSIILRFEDGSCHFTSMAHDVGTFNGRVMLDYSGAPMELAFNVQYLLESLSRFANNEVRLHIKNNTAPVVLRSAEDEQRLALLMPIKLADARSAMPPEDEEEEG
jgi:DNA polymerase-3 subunit beta